MPEINSVAGQLIGMPLAGPESFSQQQLDYLKRALGVDETVLWEGSYTATTFNTSDSPYNYKEIVFIPQYNDTAKCGNAIHVRLTPDITSINLIYTNASTLWSAAFLRLSVSSSGFSVLAGMRQLYGSFDATTAVPNYQNNQEPRFVKIIGIGRKESA